VILSPPLPNREQLCTIVPLSTTKSRSLAAYHCEIRLEPPLPFPYDSEVMWAKADMIMTVAFHRLKLLQAQQRAPDGDRLYDIRVLDDEKMAEIRDCVRRCLGF
jgi:mRNA interferase MazF